MHDSQVRVGVGPRGELTAAHLAAVRLRLVVRAGMVAQMGGIQELLLTYGAFEALFFVRGHLQCSGKEMINYESGSSK